MSPLNSDFYLKTYSDLTDDEILEGIKLRNSVSFHALYNGRTDQLKRFVLNNNGSIDQANDIEQQCIIILYEQVVGEKLSLFANTKLSTYLYAIARNLWLKEIKKGSTTISEEAIDIDLYYEDDTTFDYTNERTLKKCLIEISDGCRKLLIGKYYDKKSDSQLCEELGDVSVDNIRKRRYKCMQKLKSLFRNYQANE